MEKMKTLTIGGIRYEITDAQARDLINSCIGDLSDLVTDDTSSLVAALNEIALKGGGGSSSNNAELSVSNDSGWLSKTMAPGDSCEITVTWSSLEDGVATGEGAMTVTVNDAKRIQRTVQQGSVTVDVGEYLTAGDNVVRIKIEDAYGNSRTVRYSVSVIALSISSSFDGTAVYTGAVTYTYTPVGDVDKVVEFWIDGVKLGTTTVTVSGRQQSFQIPQRTHGAHKFEVFFTATVEGNTVESNHLYYDLIWVEEGNTTPIIASTYQGGAVSQYDTLAIPYRVYDPSNMSATVTQKVDDGVVATLTVDRTEQIWSYMVTATGDIELTLAVGDVTKSFDLTATESEIAIEAETEALSLYLSSYGRSNNEDNPGTWSHGDIAATFENFNFVSDGWVLDDDGVTVLRVSGDARLTIPYKIFANDFRTTGKTIEIEFATRDVLNYDAVLVNCMSGGRGLEITSQRATLTSEQSTIGTQYKEEEHVRLSFVIEKKANNRFLLCYINGILSGSVQYPEGDDFSQTSPVDIAIGSNECTVDIYNIRVYDNDLTRYQVLDNWIADTRVGALLHQRFARNNVYDTYGNITIGTLKKDLPYLVLECAALPQFKGDKKTCAGYYVDPVNSTKSFSFQDAEIDVQGTSSQYYYVKNYKIKFKGGFILASGMILEDYQLNADVIPTSTYTFKADVASSEGANNVVLAQIYNDLCPVKTPPQEEDPRVRQTIDGHPIVIFWDNGSGPAFIGKYNFNHDKGTEEVFGFTEGDESWEILQNGTDRVGWKDADFSGDAWKTDFEARYPEDNVDTTNLTAFAAWLVTTNTEAATGTALATTVTYDGVDYTTDSVEYRLAKFRAELPEHANVDALVFYYVITEIFLCIDQREKNAFPTLWAKNPLWMMLFYDADSSLGIDNKGNLAFDYYLEDIDYTEAGDPIYNGQNSVLWANLRETYYAEITAEYQRLRTSTATDGSSNSLISYDVVNNLFEAHQSKWSEAIYNEDMYRKCLEPMVVAGDGLYLPMLQGKKEQQRKWWLYNRFRYLDSKYVTGSSMETRITIRAHAKANIKLMSYVNMYGHVYYNAEMVEHRMTRGQEYEFVWAASGAEDPVIGINDADMLTSIGDLSPLMVELIDISKATHLTSLKVGDAASSYVNNNLNSITLGNNILLRTIDLRNCASLTQAVDASGCTGLEEAYFDGTAIAGLTLPNGGNLKTLHLPGTLTSLSLRNQSALTDFVLPNYSGITTLRLENNSNVVDPLAIFGEIPEQSRVRLIGLNKEFSDSAELISFLTRLDVMRGLDENGNNADTAQVSGYLHVAEVNALQAEVIEAAREKYPSLTIEYDTVRKFVVKFYNGDTLLQTVSQIDYGGSAVYTGATPTKEAADASEEWRFIGWDKNTSYVTGDMDVYAVFGNVALKAIKLVERTLSGEYVNNTATALGAKVFDGMSITSARFSNVTDVAWGAFDWYGALKEVSFPKAQTVGANAFYHSGLTGAIDMPEVTSIGGNAFDTTGITSVNFPKLTSIGSGAFSSCGSLQSVNIPLVTTLASGNTENVFLACSALTTLDLPSVTTIGGYAFRGCSKLSAVILRSETVCTLKVSYSFMETPIASGTGYIYVPAALVDSYKVATNWSAFADQIRAIEDYPEVCDPYSWGAVASHIEVGDYATFYSIGDTVPLDMGDLGVAQMQIAAFDTDDLADGSGKAPITWVARRLPNSAHRMNAEYDNNTEGTGAIGGWEKCEMRSYLSGTVMPYIPSDVQTMLKSVTKTQPAYDINASKYTQTTADYLWIPSVTEITTTWSELFSDSSAFKRWRADGLTTSWYTRSAATSKKFYYYTTRGDQYQEVDVDYNIVLCFCT